MLSYFIDNFKVENVLHSDIARGINKAFPYTKACKGITKPLIEVLGRELKYIDTKAFFTHVPTPPGCYNNYTDNKNNNCLAWRIARFVNVAFEDHMASSKAFYHQYRTLLRAIWGDGVEGWLNPSAVHYRQHADIWCFRTPFTRELNARCARNLQSRLKSNTIIDTKTLNNNLGKLDMGSVADCFIIVAIGTGLRSQEIHSKTKIEDAGDGKIRCLGLCKKRDDYVGIIKPVVVFSVETIMKCYDVIREAGLPITTVKSRASTRIKSLFGSDYTAHKLRGLYSNISYITCPVADSQIEHIRRVCGHENSRSSLHYNTYRLI